MITLILKAIALLISLAPAPAPASIEPAPVVIEEDVPGAGFGAPIIEAPIEFYDIGTAYEPVQS